MSYKIKKKKVLGRTKVKIKDSEGRKKKFVYDKQGNLIKDVEVDFDNKGIKKRTTKKIKNNKVVKTKTMGGFAEPFGATSEMDGFQKYKKGGKMSMKGINTDGLTDRQIETLKKHSKHHTAKHMKTMVNDMKSGATFSASHKKAQKKVGASKGLKAKKTTYLYGGMVPKMGPAKKFISDSAPFSTKVDEYYRSN